MIVRKFAKPTLTPVEAHHGDTIEFTLLNGRKIDIHLDDTGARIVSTTLRDPNVEEPGAMTIYRFWCDIRVNGEPHRLEREVGTQASFYEPWEIEGVRIWLDAVDAIFDFMHETHSPCRLQPNCSLAMPPRRHARFALQDASARICPELLYPWCPLPEGILRIEQCYRGEDCWMGAFDGASAHGGLDINHPKGTPLHTPISLDTQFYYNSLEMGHNNNRWLGIRRWPDGSEWMLRTCHMLRLTVPERQPLPRGTHFAEGAGVYVGSLEHSHFAFAVHEDGENFLLDPWILFWQMYRDLPHLDTEIRS